MNHFNHLQGREAQGWPARRYTEVQAIQPAPAEACTEVGADDDGGEWKSLDFKDKLFISYVIILLTAISMGGLWLALLLTKP